MFDLKKHLTKRLIKTISIVASVLLALSIILAIFYLAATMDYNTDINANVESEIKIIRNANGIPSIKTETKNDIFFALGYIHGQDRLSLMEYYRMLATGSAKKLLKDDGEILDRIVRIAGIRSTAVKILEKMPNEHKAFLDSYTSGINTIRPKWNKFLSSYIIDRPWESRDVIAILLLREWTNSFLNNKELLFPMETIAQQNGMNEIIPKNMQSFYNDELSNNINLLKKIKSILKTQIGHFNRGFAFSIPADLIAETREYHAFSFDTPYARRPDWYPVNINYAGTVIQGITCAGLPFILSGQTEDFFFCGLNLNIDTQDFIFEEVKTSDGIARYFSNGTWHEFNPVEEPVFNPISSTDEHEIIWHTANGPVLNDVSGETNYKRGVLTMRHILPGEDYLVSLFNLPFSENTMQVLQTVRKVNSLPKVYFIGEQEKNTAVYSGKFPIRAFSTDAILSNRTIRPAMSINLDTIVNSTKYSLAGSDSTEALNEMIKTYTLSNSIRYEHLDNLIGSAFIKEVKTAEQIKTILKDTKVPWAEKFVPIFLKNLAANPTTSARLTRVYLNKWDFTAQKNSVASTLFHSILLNFIDASFTDKAGLNTDDIIENHEMLIDPFFNLLSFNFSLFFDDKKTESFETSADIFDRAFLKTLRECSRKMGPIMDDWNWSKLHKNYYNMPIRRNILARLTTDIQRDAPQSGGGATIYNNGIDFDLRPKSNSSLLGYFSMSSAEIATNFSYSLYPLSKFFSNFETKQAFVPFDFNNNTSNDTLVFIKNTNN